ncbi:hypothetical protein MUCCIDRAFT_109532 [Mucor lusitanicus CBS 277.49]|uniref:Uncharacterized protein n=1 Tax=Mucor lusitanicus CBS 277.49 TaxID=747725 RepID=A0A168KS75_MUCCL|nr:hypothetical protein MUCCIDRAFT_109532 [Mucor lusitanicus CBS 277.49]
MPAPEFALPPAHKPYSLAFVAAGDEESMNSLSIECITTKDMDIEFLGNMLMQM